MKVDGRQIAAEMLLHVWLCRKNVLIQGPDLPEYESKKNPAQIRLRFLAYAGNVGAVRTHAQKIARS